MNTLSQKKERILIVDDTPANIDVLGAILMPDYEISVAVNGPMALDILNSGITPDLILLDIMMPEMDGYEVARQIKADEKIREIPLIFITAKIEEEDETRGFEMGAVDYIRKPVNSSVTLARIKSQLELKRYRDNLSKTIQKKNIQVQVSKNALITEKHKLTQASEDLAEVQASAHKNQIYFKELFSNSPHGIILVGPDNKIINANKSFSKLLGYDIIEIINKKTSGFSVADNLKDAHNSLIRRALAQGTMSMETKCFHKKGYKINVSALAYPVKINNKIQGVFVFYENISQRKLFENKLKHQAFHDALTGIPNRLLFAERLNFAIDTQNQDPSFGFAVLLIDLDRFKRVNDSLGHHAGDVLLKAVTLKIHAYLRDEDTLARMGGDEFAILLSNVKNVAEIKTIANRVRQAVESCFIIEGQEVYISASIGIVYETRFCGKAASLLRDADLAMYHAKDEGKAQFKFFTPDMRETLMTSMTTEKDLRKAVETNDLVLYYQPIVDIPTARVNGLEALVRWQHQTKGLIPPDQFIPIAEETGLIIPMGEWIINQACKDLIALHQTHGQDLTMSINISIKQFLQKTFTQKLLETVTRHGLSPAQIKLEFTESLLMAHTRSAVQKLERLKSMGFILVIDDFGTGYSSLAYLQQFPIDQIKIDRSFTSSMNTSENSFEIVKSILSLSRSLNLTAVAEGVETEDQLAVLHQLSCQNAQGYFFSRPIPLGQLLKIPNLGSPKVSPN
jgi:Amt family ammonium transporter